MAVGEFDLRIRIEQSSNLDSTRLHIGAMTHAVAV